MPTVLSFDRCQKLWGQSKQNRGKLGSESTFQVNHFRFPMTQKQKTPGVAARGLVAAGAAQASSDTYSACTSSACRPFWPCATLKAGTGGQSAFSAFFHGKINSFRLTAGHFCYGKSNQNHLRRTRAACGGPLRSSPGAARRPNSLRYAALKHGRLFDRSGLRCSARFKARTSKATATATAVATAMLCDHPNKRPRALPPGVLVPMVRRKRRVGLTRPALLRPAGPSGPARP